LHHKTLHQGHERRREPVYTGEEGKEITRYAMAAYLSAQESRDVHLDEITTEGEESQRFKLRTNFCNL